MPIYNGTLLHQNIAKHTQEMSASPLYGNIATPTVQILFGLKLYHLPSDFATLILCWPWRYLMNR